MTTFKLRRLHRQRARRRNTARILDHEELAAHFCVAEDQVQDTLVAAGWDFHRDANGRIWASVSEEALAAASPREKPQ